MVISLYSKCFFFFSEFDAWFSADLFDYEWFLSCSTCWRRIEKEMISFVLKCRRCYFGRNYNGHITSEDTDMILLSIYDFICIGIVLFRQIIFFMKIEY